MLCETTLIRIGAVVVAVDFAEGRCVQAPGIGAKTDHINLESLRLNPPSGVLEYERVLVIGLLYVPVIPAVTCSLVEVSMSWRKWLWKMSHETMLNPHRSDSETCKMFERMGWWPTLARDSADRFVQCSVCQQYRGIAMRPPTRSMAASDAMSALLPW